MSTTNWETANRETTRGGLTVTCPECGDGIGVEMAAEVETTDHAPDGIIEVTCGDCGAEFAVGFRRTEE